MYQSFERIVVWRKAHTWVRAIYRYTEQFPRHELFGLTSQLRRAAVSVPANIAEGYKRRSRADKVRFYNISQASLEECRYYLILARDLGYGDSSQLKDAPEEISRMLDAYVRRVSEAAREPSASDTRP